MTKDVTASPTYCYYCRILLVGYPNKQSTMTNTIHINQLIPHPDQNILRPSFLEYLVPSFSHPSSFHPHSVQKTGCQTSQIRIRLRSFVSYTEGTILSTRIDVDDDVNVVVIHIIISTTFFPHPYRPSRTWACPGS